MRPPIDPERKAEIEREIVIMRKTQDLVATWARAANMGEFGVFAALISSYADLAKVALDQGRDYVGEANLVRIKPHHAVYLGEKFDRLFGRWLDANPAACTAFLYEAGFVTVQGPKEGEP